MSSWKIIQYVICSNLVFFYFFASTFPINMIYPHHGNSFVACFRELTAYRGLTRFGSACSGNSCSMPTHFLSRSLMAVEVFISSMDFGWHVVALLTLCLPCLLSSLSQVPLSAFHKVLKAAKLNNPPPPFAHTHLSFLLILLRKKNIPLSHSEAHLFFFSETPWVLGRSSRSCTPEQLPFQKPPLT